MQKITIALDGHSSCGKSTMAKQLAKNLGYIYVDTGAMYRSVTLYAMRNNILDNENNVDSGKLQKAMKEIQISFVLDKEGKPEAYLNGERVEDDIRGIEVSRRVSIIAAMPFVREALVAMQRKMGEEGGVVMDGRDIGTTVFPNAELKIFVTASAEVRAQRRYDELTAKGETVCYNDILNNVRERDYIDSHREVSPLRKADDALLLDNSNMTIPEQNVWLKEKVEEALQKNTSA